MPKKIVVLVNNPATHDTRVIKQASSLAAEGYEVVVIGRAAEGIPDHETRDGVRYRRVPRVPFNYATCIIKRAADRTSAFRPVFLWA
ncbi:MAG TPA: hypothetical protein PLV77_06085, partial [Solirubrobacterales bacterium]|nr:hypothetical protein [Solirubrobacterales bacterium]